MVDFLSSWNWRLLKSRYFHVKFFIPLARGSCEVGIYSHRGGQVQSPGNTSQRVKESAFSDFSEKTNLFLTLCSRQVYIYMQKRIHFLEEVQMRWLKDVQGRENLEKKRRKNRNYGRIRIFAKNSDHNGTCNLKVLFTRASQRTTNPFLSLSILSLQIFDPSFIFQNRVDTKSRK